MADEKPADPLRTAIRMANQARGAKQSKLLQPEEIERLLRQADLLQQNAVWLNLELDALACCRFHGHPV